MISRLLWSDIAPNRAFHAHLWHLNHRFLPHCHDFWEAFLVLKGGGTHLCNGRKETLKAGNLHLIRPDDTHSIVIAGSAYINIAWPAPGWEKWRAVAGLETRFESAVAPVTALDLEPLFRRMTQVFALNGAGQALEVARFWGEIAARWENETPSLASYPEWMQRAIQTFDVFSVRLPHTGSTNGACKSPPNCYCKRRYQSKKLPRVADLTTFTTFTAFSVTALGCRPRHTV
jgi:hypothetical protein